MAKSEERLQAILATLEQCRAALVKEVRPETAKLVSLAILDLRIDLSKIPDTDLKALAMRDDAGQRAGRTLERSELAPQPAQTHRAETRQIAPRSGHEPGRLPLPSGRRLIRTFRNEMILLHRVLAAICSLGSEDRETIG